MAAELLRAGSLDGDGLVRAMVAGMQERGSRR